MHAGGMGPTGFQGPQGLGIFESFNDDMMHIGGGPSFHAAGGSRGSKAPKSKKDDDDDDKYTTVMLRNIPNKYTRGMLIEQLHRTGFRGDIDYLYLPTDFANRCNVGYCFVNLRTPLARARFTNAFDGVAAQSCLPGFNSYKVCQVTKAKWQGRDENVRRLRSGPELMAQLAAHPEWLPLILDEQGNQEPFLCDEGAPSAHGGPTVPRRQSRKAKGQGPLSNLIPPGPADAWTLAAQERYAREGLNGLLDGVPGVPGPPAMPGGGFGRGGGRGAGAGGRGGQRRRGGRGGLPVVPGAYPDIAGGSPYPGGGIPMAAMPVPVMTEQGLQYVPFESAYGGEGSGYLLAYPAMPDQQLYGMPYPASYPGFPAYGWPEGAGGPVYDPYMAAGGWPRPPRQQRGRRRGGLPAGMEEAQEPDDGEDDDEGLQG